jgi:malate synthase
MASRRRSSKKTRANSRVAERKPAKVTRKSASKRPAKAARKSSSRAKAKRPAAKPVVDKDREKTLAAVAAKPKKPRPPWKPQSKPKSNSVSDVAPASAPPPIEAGVEVRGHLGPRYEEIFTPDALAFLGALHRTFAPVRRQLLAARADRQRRYDAGALPGFLPETAEIRTGDWTVAPIPDDLQNRRVEITGPVDRKMIVNALNSGATHYMADFEDAHAPTWTNVVEGQINLRDYWAGQIGFIDPQSRKRYDVGLMRAVLIVRPRGWHLDEVHLTVDGEPMSAALFDFGLYFFHNAQKQIYSGSGPYFYLPKLESHAEARLWNDVFLFAQKHIGVWPGTVKATVLVETLPAAFEMDEILWELREHIAGMNAGRWDYIFSFIKTFARNPDFVLPDRSQIVMGKAFLGAYADLLVKTCHRRGALAMGGMAAQIPVKDDEAANEAAFARVREDKEREVREGYDGTWVAHPDLVPVAKEVFDRLMPQPNQLDKLREDVDVTRDDLLHVHDGTKTEEGFRLNIRVGVQYLEAWLSGRGAVPIYHLMEDAATAEIARAQIWQWLKYGAMLDTGMTCSRAFFERAMHEEMLRIKDEVGARHFSGGRFAEAEKLFRQLVLGREFVPFLTILAYPLIA